MKLEGEQILLRVYLRNTDKHAWFSSPAAEEIVQEARVHGLAGATILRGFFGLDVNGQLLDTGVWSIVEHVPVIVEIVDTAQAIGAFLSVVERVVLEGIATLERGHVLMYRHSRASEGRTKLRSDIPGVIPALSTIPTPEDFPIMKTSDEGQLLRVFIGESDERNGEPLYRSIVLKARELGLAGATVLRSPMGFGANTRMHTTQLLELSTDLPVIIEIVDSADKLQLLLPFLDEVVTEGLITIEAVRVLKYRHNENKTRPSTIS